MTEELRWVQLVGALVGNLGFPIFVAIYLLTTLTPSVRALTRAVEELTHLLHEERGAQRRRHGSEIAP